MRQLIIAGMLVLTGACSTVPDSVKLPEEVSPVSYQEVASDPDKSKSRMARWGGVVANIENKKDGTLLEVVHFPLRSYGRPVAYDESIGRFRVYVNGFLDPMVYQKGRMMTFAGEVIGAEEGMVGEHMYVYPTLQASGYHLWEDYDRIEVETISVWPSFHYRRGFYGRRGWFGWDIWPYHQRVIVRRRHDHHQGNHHSDNDREKNYSQGSVRTINNEGQQQNIKHPKGSQNGRNDP